MCNEEGVGSVKSVRDHKLHIFLRDDLTKLSWMSVVLSLKLRSLSDWKAHQGAITLRVGYVNIFLGKTSLPVLSYLQDLSVSESNLNRGRKISIGQKLNAMLYRVTFKSCIFYTRAHRPGGAIFPVKSHRQNKSVLVSHRPVQPKSTRSNWLCKRHAQRQRSQNIQHQ